VRVALIGANGHGHWHRRHLAQRPAFDVVALCDLQPIADVEGAPVDRDTALFTDHRAMLAATTPDLVIVCTPPHTHLALACDALRAGCDVLLEKPPLLSSAEHASLSAVCASTGRAVQVGFQALGSAALAEVLAAVDAGALGTVTGVSALAAWQRPDAYYTRAPWAGRRRVNGQPVIDGALVNPLAHAVMQAAAVAAATGDPSISTVELSRHRTRRIEVEDTAVMRVTTATGLPVVVAVTLCGEEFIPGEITVHGTSGRAVLEYPTDRVTLPGETARRDVPGRTSLLDNLAAHRRDRTVPLIVPLDRTAPFTRLVEVIAEAPDPAPVPPALVTSSGAGDERRLTIAGINEALRTCADQLAMPHEVGLTWAGPATRIQLTPR
jgi:predicted dehydrogenase